MASVPPAITNIHAEGSAQSFVYGGGPEVLCLGLNEREKTKRWVRSSPIQLTRPGEGGGVWAPAGSKALQPAHTKAARPEALAGNRDPEHAVSTTLNQRG